MKHLLIATNDFFRRCFEPIRFIKTFPPQNYHLQPICDWFDLVFTGPSFSLAHGPLVHRAWEQRSWMLVMVHRRPWQWVGILRERSSYLMREVVRCHPNVWVGFGMSKLDCASRESFPKWFGGYALCHRFLPTVTTSVGLLIQIQRNSSFLAKNPSTFPHQRCLLRLPSDSQH